MPHRTIDDILADAGLDRNGNKLATAADDSSGKKGKKGKKSKNGTPRTTAQILREAGIASDAQREDREEQERQARVAKLEELMGKEPGYSLYNEDAKARAAERQAALERELPKYTPSGFAITPPTRENGRPIGAAPEAAPASTPETRLPEPQPSTGNEREAMLAELDKAFGQPAPEAPAPMPTTAPTPAPTPAAATVPTAAPIQETTDPAEEAAPAMPEAAAPAAPEEDSELSALQERERELGIAYRDALTKWRNKAKGASREAVDAAYEAWQDAQTDIALHDPKWIDGKYAASMSGDESQEELAGKMAELKRQQAGLAQMIKQATQRGDTQWADTYREYKKVIDDQIKELQKGIDAYRPETRLTDVEQRAVTRMATETADRTEAGIEELAGICKVSKDEMLEAMNGSGDEFAALLLKADKAKAGRITEIINAIGEDAVALSKYKTVLGNDSDTFAEAIGHAFLGGLMGIAGGVTGAVAWMQETDAMIAKVFGGSGDEYMENAIARYEDSHDFLTRQSEYLQQAKAHAGKLQDIAVDLVENTTEMLPDITINAIAAATGVEFVKAAAQTLALGFMGTRVFGSTSSGLVAFDDDGKVITEDGKIKGNVSVRDENGKIIAENEVGYWGRTIASGATAGIEIATERMFDGLGGIYGEGLVKAGKSAAGDVAEKELFDLFQEQILSSVTNTAAKPALAAVLTLGFGMAGEGLEEVVSGICEPITNIFTMDPDTWRANYGIDESSGWIVDIAKAEWNSRGELGYSMLIGSLMGMFGSVTSAVGAYGEQAYANNAETAEKMNAFLKGEAKLSEVITEETRAKMAEAGITTDEQIDAIGAQALKDMADAAQQQGIEVPAMEEITAQQQETAEAAGMTEEQQAAAAGETAAPAEETAPVGLGTEDARSEKFAARETEETAIPQSAEQTAEEAAPAFEEAAEEAAPAFEDPMQTAGEQFAEQFTLQQAPEATAFEQSTETAPVDIAEETAAAPQIERVADLGQMSREEIDNRLQDELGPNGGTIGKYEVNYMPSGRGRSTVSVVDTETGELHTKNIKHGMETAAAAELIEKNERSLDNNGRIHNRERGRQPGTYSERQTGGVQKSTGTVSQAETARSRQTAAETAGDYEYRSSRDIIGEDGTEAADLRVIPERDYDDELKKIDADIQQKTGKKPIFFLGMAKIEGLEGKGVTGCFADDGQISVQCDSMKHSATQLAEHEYLHYLVASGKIDVQDMMSELVGNGEGQISPEECQKAAKKYTDHYAGAYDAETAAALGYEEMACDLYAGITDRIRGMKLGSESNTLARDYVDGTGKYGSSQQAQNVQEDTGPPAEKPLQRVGLERLNRSEAEGEPVDIKSMAPKAETAAQNAERAETKQEAQPEEMTAAPAEDQKQTERDWAKKIYRALSRAERGSDAGKLYEFANQGGVHNEVEALKRKANASFTKDGGNLGRASDHLEEASAERYIAEYIKNNGVKKPKSAAERFTPEQLRARQAARTLLHLKELRHANETPEGSMARDLAGKSGWALAQLDLFGATAVFDGSSWLSGSNVAYSAKNAESYASEWEKANGTAKESVPFFASVLAHGGEAWQSKYFNVDSILEYAEQTGQLQPDDIELEAQWAARAEQMIAEAVPEYNDYLAWRDGVSEAEAAQQKAETAEPKLAPVSLERLNKSEAEGESVDVRGMANKVKPASRSMFPANDFTSREESAPKLAGRARQLQPVGLERLNQTEESTGEAAPNLLDMVERRPAAANGGNADISKQIQDMLDKDEGDYDTAFTIPGADAVFARAESGEISAAEAVTELKSMTDAVRELAQTVADKYGDFDEDNPVTDYFSENDDTYSEMAAAGTPVEEVVRKLEADFAEAYPEEAAAISQQQAEPVKGSELEEMDEPVPAKAETEKAKREIKKALTLPVQKSNAEALEIGLSSGELTADMLTFSGTVSGLNAEQRYVLADELIKGLKTRKKETSVKVPYDGQFSIVNTRENVATVLTRIGAKVTQEAEITKTIDSWLKKASGKVTFEINGQWYVCDGKTAVAISQRSAEFAQGRDGYNAKASPDGARLAGMLVGDEQITAQPEQASYGYGKEKASAIVFKAADREIVLDEKAVKLLDGPGVSFVAGSNPYAIKAVNPDGSIKGFAIGLGNAKVYDRIPAKLKAFAEQKAAKKSDRSAAPAQVQGLALPAAKDYGAAQGLMDIVNSGSQTYMQDAIRAMNGMSDEELRKAYEDMRSKTESNTEKWLANTILQNCETRGMLVMDDNMADQSLDGKGNFFKDDYSKMFPPKKPAAKEAAEKKPAAKKPARKTAEKKAESKTKTEETDRLEDFGEKIGGARKDLWKKRGLDIRDLVEMNEAERGKYVKKDNVWPKTDYQELVNNGAEREAAYLIKKVRDALPTAPQARFTDANNGISIDQRQEQFINFVKTIRAGLENVKTVDDFQGFIDNVLVKNGWARRDTDYRGRPDISYVHSSTEINLSSDIIDAARLAMFPKQLAAEMEKKQFLVAKDQKIPAGYSVGMNDGKGWGRSTAQPGTFYVTKGHVILQDNFESREAAVKYLQDLVASKKKSGKSKFVPRQLESIHRTGRDVRSNNTKHIDGDDMMSTFHFRGGEFGNWNSTKDRQVSMDYAYDALTDLADLLGIDPADISLGNELAIAFGSRGVAGAAAHYEPDRRVINLTKMNGAGSLGHEWAHALDNIIGQMLGASKFMTSEAYKVKLPSLTKLMNAMKYKAASAETAAAAAEKDLKRYRNNIQAWISSEFNGRFQQNATQSQMDRFKALVDEALSGTGEYADWYYNDSAGVVGKLSDLHKEVTGRMIPKDTRKNLASYLYQLNQKVKAAENPKATEMTDFYKGSKRFDEIHSKEDKGYWASDEEMFARAFACYLHDKAAAIDTLSDYLSGHSESAVSIDFDKDGNPNVVKAIPAGEERAYINQCFDELLAELKEKGMLHAPAAEPDSYSVARYSLEDEDSNWEYSDTETQSRKSTRYSLEDADAEYAAATTEEEKQSIIDKAALNWGAVTDDDGNPKHYYHGSGSFGFTEFDLSFMDDRRSIFITDNQEVAKSYGGGETRAIKDAHELSQTVKDMSDAELVEELNKKHNLPYRLYTPYDDIIKENEEELDSIAESMKMWTENSFWLRLRKRKAIEKMKQNAAIITDAIESWKAGEIGENKFYERVAEAVDLISNTDKEIAKHFGEQFDDGWIMTLVSFAEDAKAEKANGYIAAGPSNEHHTRKEIMRFLQKETKMSGSYDLYAQDGNYLVVDSKEPYNWNMITYDMVDGGNITEILQDAYEKGRRDDDGLLTTRQVSKTAHDLGYDGVVFRKIVDIGGYGYEPVPSEVRVIFNPNKVKSADAETVVDGYTIKPSERFSNSNDLRYSLEDTEADAAENTTEGKPGANLDWWEKYRQSFIKQNDRDEFRGTANMAALGINIAGNEGVYDKIEALKMSIRAMRSVKKATEAAEKRLHASLAEKTFAKDIAAGIYQESDIPSTMNADKVTELADFYFAEEGTSDKMMKKQKALVNKKLDQKMFLLMGEHEVKRMPKSYKLNFRTPLRSMREIFGDKAGKEIFDTIFAPVEQNTAERDRFRQRMYDAVEKFTGEDGKQSKLTKKESALVMAMIENEQASILVKEMEMGNAVDKRQASGIRQAVKNIQEGKSIGDALKEWESDERTKRTVQQLVKWEESQKLIKDQNLDTVKLENAAKTYAAQFAAFYDAINDLLAAHGYEPIGFIKGYAPHMQEEHVQTALQKALTAFGITEDVTNLPTEIAGMTANFRPSKRWNPYFLQRNGEAAKQDIVEAYESYVDYMSDVIYHMDDIMRVRAFERYFRETYSDDNVRDLIEEAKDAAEGSLEQKLEFLREKNKIGPQDMLSDEAADEMLQQFVSAQYEQFKEHSTHGPLVTWLTDYANNLAAKQLSYDRGTEYLVGRKALNFANKLTRTFGTAQVGAKISSILNQGAQLPQIYAELGNKYTARAMKDFMFGRIRKGAWAESSDFLTTKRGVESIAPSMSDMIVTKMFAGAEFVDNMMSTLAVRGKYLQGIDAGLSPKEAMKAADRFGSDIMGSRAKGTKPLAFESKNPIVRMATMFQIEALNSWDHIISDLPHDFRDIEKTQGRAKAAMAVANVVLKSLIAAFLLNRLDDELYGGSPAPFDILGLTANFVASGNGMRTNDVMAVMINDMWKRATDEELFEVDDSRLNDGKFNWQAAAKNLGENAMNDVPIVRNLASLLGWGDSSLPFAGSGVDDLVAKLMGEEDGKSWPETLRKFGLGFVPGGSQLERTIEGAEALRDGGVYTSKGKLKYAIDNDPMTIARVLAFGKYSTPEAQRYFADIDYSGKMSNAMSDSQQRAYDVVKATGLSNTEAESVVRGLFDSAKSMSVDKNGNPASSINQDGAKAALDAAELPRSLKAVMWQMFNKSWKGTNNPYDTKLGSQVYEALQTGGGLDGLSLPGLG